jgi:NDP-sugar pyrophosphorylase family protein
MGILRLLERLRYGRRYDLIAGDMGTRMQEETKTKPKALVTLGGLPIMWHMMKYFVHFGFSDFVIALGYKGDTVRDYFSATSEDGGGELMAYRHKSFWRCMDTDKEREALEQLWV